MGPDGLDALLIHHLGRGWDFSDEERVGKPDDVGGQSDGWDLDDHVARKRTVSRM